MTWTIFLGVLATVSTAGWIICYVFYRIARRDADAWRESTWTSHRAIEILDDRLTERSRHADDLLALASEMYAFVSTHPDFCDAEADEIPERARELGIDI